MIEPKQRELRVHDIPCTAKGCGAASGEFCRNRNYPHADFMIHPERTAEHEQLVAEGWHWQEPIALDKGARRSK